MWERFYIPQFRKTKIPTTGTHKDFEIILGAIEKNKVSLQISLKRNSTNYSYISILSVNFENLIVRLHVLIIFFLHVKFQEDQKSIAISSNKC